MYKNLLLALPYLFYLSLMCSPAMADPVMLETIDVVAKNLDESRTHLTTNTGSSVYTFESKNIDSLPQGNNSQLSDVLLRAPGAVQDSYGEVHVRGDHGNLQYRLNGIILPESISGFGQAIDVHFIHKMDFLRGALPAQYGYRTAGVIDITTKTGANQLQNGGKFSTMIGSNNTLQSNQEIYGKKVRAEYYFTATYNQNDRGIQPPTSGMNAIHDATNGNKEFGYMSYAINDNHRASFIFGNTVNNFQIPNNPNQSAQYNLQGVQNINSSKVNETQNENSTYAIAAIQGKMGKFEYQTSVFTRNSAVGYNPDINGDLIFNGIAGSNHRSSLISGMQSDGTYRLNKTHTLRSGLFTSYETAKTLTNTSVFTTDSNGDQISHVPFSIMDNATQTAKLAGIYLQDEWSVTKKLTINYGGRFDYYSAYVTESQFSPRIGAIYNPIPATTLHAGYSRYFTPPQTELISSPTIALFNNTTGALSSTQSSPVVPERANYFDIGIAQKFTDEINGSIDIYYKESTNVFDNGQFGQSLIYAPFNYQYGIQKGIEFTLDYTHENFSAYGNLAVSSAQAKGVASGQFNFTQDELNYTQNNWIFMDHNQTYTASVGTSYKATHDIIYSADAIYGSGLGSGYLNTSHMPGYTQVNLSVSRSFRIFNENALIGVMKDSHLGKTNMRFSIINAFDQTYELRDGSGIGVFAPQYGPRRGWYFTITQGF